MRSRRRSTPCDGGVQPHGAGALGAEGWHTPRRAGYSASPDRLPAVQTLVWADPNVYLRQGNLTSPSSP